MERKPLYKVGDEVAHVDNLQVKMYVDRIIKKGMKEPTGKMLDGKPVMQPYKILIGIECHWWQEEKGQKTFMKCKFHSRELLPWEDAQKKQQRYEKGKI